MSEVVAYRHAAHDSPWWASPNGRGGRFHRSMEAPTQYLSLHPLGPAAEVLRHHVGPEAAEDADTVLLNLWAARVDADGIVDVGFDDCETHGIAPDELVGEDYRPTQRLAQRLRAEGATGIRVPSAALPGADSLVLFGPAVAHPYLWEPVTREERPTGHLSDGARPSQEVVPLVRWIGWPHPALEVWKRTGAYQPLDDPVPAAR